VRQIAMILVFDLGGPLLVYSLLRSAGLSAVTALILSGIPPALGILISAVVDRRLDIIGVLVLAGLAVGTVAGLVSNNARLYLVEGAVPSLVFAVACLISLRSRKPLIYRFTVELLGQDTPKGREVVGAWQYPGFRRAFRVITAAWGVAYFFEVAPGRGGNHLHRDRAAVFQADSLSLRLHPVPVDTGLRRAREEEGRAPGRGRRGPGRPLR
jgi:hypothetical protein